ncbi:hypothetical protein B0H34DRAFT_676769 [Crassisporium funariophilum]|nr:hypothetical protein B0H34DRAFT_676769 [Crassisporium funariophilum]
MSYYQNVYLSQTTLPEEQLLGDPKFQTTGGPDYDDPETLALFLELCGLTQTTLPLEKDMYANRSGADLRPQAVSSILDEPNHFAQGLGDCFPGYQQYEAPPAFNAEGAGYPSAQDSADMVPDTTPDLLVEGRMTVDPSELHLHERRGAQRCGCQCPKCGQCFTRQHDLRRHTMFSKKCSEMEIYGTHCPHCDEGLRRPDSVLRHIRDSCPKFSRARNKPKKPKAQKDRRRHWKREMTV